MYNLHINELTPGRKYYVKVRAKAPDLAVSEWSQVFELTTSQDTVPPHRVGNLTFISEGDAFVAKWDAPTINADTTPCNDLSHYFIRLTDIDGAKTVELQSSTTAFTLDINSNKQLFGNLAGRVKIEVAAVDTVGNTGALEEAIAVNPAPAKVTGVTATAGVETVRVGWDLGAETDISHYEIHMSTSGSSFAVGPSTLMGQAAASADNYTQTTSSLVPVYFKVVAVDKFNQKSIPSDAASAQPRLSTDYDKTPPGAVSGFTVTQVLAPDNTSATARVSFTAVSGSDLDKYEIQYRKTGDNTSPWSFTNVPSDQTTAEIKPLPLSTSYDFKIRAVDFNSNKGEWSSVVVAPGVKKTTLPAAPTGVTVRGGMSNLMITWNASTDPSMANWAGTYEVQVSKASTFTSPTTIKTSSTLASFTNLDQNTVYYARVRSLDPYGNTGAWSTTVNGNTGLVADANASRVIWSDTEPTSGKTNDLWIKTPENVQYRFDGTNWIKAQDTELAGEIDNVRQTADGKNKAWYQTTKPPATNNTQGDLWFDTANGNKLHVWSATASDWVSAQDAAIQDALDDAADALQTADGKNTIYYSTPPATGLKEGDTWFDNAVIKVYKNGGWVDASTALDNAKANQAIQIAGSKNKTYYVAKASATGMIEGDVLFDSADGNKQYRYNGTTWVAVTDAAIAAAEAAAGQAQQTADKKNTIYYSTPPTTGLKDGDTWFDGPTIKTYRNGVWTDSSSNLETQQGSDALQVAGSKNKTYYTTYANRPTTGLTAGDLLFDTGNKYKAYRYNGSAWASVQDGTIADAKTAADNAKAAAELRAQTFYEETGPANTNSRLKTNDLWIRSTDNQLHRWTGSAWVEIQDDAIALTQANLTTAVTNLQGDISNVNDKADGKVDSFIQNTAPTTATEGDIWFDTSVTPVAVKVRRGANWEVSGDKAALDAAAAVQVNLNATNTALNKKNTTYAQTSAPTANLVVGDLWLDTTLVSGTPKNEMNRWDGTEWVKVQDKTIFDVQALADGKATVFTKATMPTNAESDLGDIWFDTSTTPWGVKVRTGSSTWTVSGDKAARDAATAAQTEAARKIQSFYTDTDPATVPANNVKPGDLWYKTSDKRARVRASNNTWVELKDTAIDAAQTAANNAQTTANTAITNAQNAFNLADGKAQVFWGGTRPSNLVAADAGDIWVDTSKTPNEIQVWSGTAWAVTGDPATKAIADAANTLAGQKAYTYIQNAAPTTSTVPAPAKGDIWIKNNVTPNEVSVYTGSAWVAAGDKTARDSAGAKAHVFTTTNDTAPTSPTPKRGDVWINTTTGKTKVHTGTAWVDSTDPEARTLANSKITTYYNATSPTAPVGGFTTGDLWVRTTDNRLHRWAGSWVELKDKSITDLEALTDDIIDDLIPGLETQLDNKIEVYVQNDAPAITDAAKQKGDIWIRPANGEVKVYSGTAWVVSADPAAKALANTAQTAANNAATAAGNAQTTADKKMQTFYGTTGPANNPAGTLQVNDLWIHSTTKRLNRWTGSVWQEVKDADITAAQNAAAAAQSTATNALTNAGNAFDLADGKANVFWQNTAPTGLVAADKGDIWVNTAKTPNEVNAWSGTAWIVTGDPATKTLAEAAQTLAGQKAYVYTQTTQPTTSSNPKPTRGDTWIHTTTGETKIYTGSAWVATTDPAAQAIANKKITTYYGSNNPSVPTGGFTTGDLWVKTPENRMNRWSGTVWAEIKDAAITAVEGTVSNLSNTIIPNLTTQIDNKVEVTVGGTRPSYASATAAQRAAAKGDMHIDTATGLVTVYSGVANTWNEVKDPAAAQAATDAATLAGKKVQVFGGELAPSNSTANALQVNDLWIRDSDKKMHRWGGSAWEIAQDAAIAGLESKGTDLVINGTGILGNNYNFSRWVFDPSDAPAGARGSFMSSTMSYVIEADSDIPYDTSKTYKLSYSLRKGNPDVGTGHYAGFIPKDAAGNTVGPSHYMFIGNTTTTLAAALNPGDTQVVLTNSANWYGTPGKNAGSSTHMRSIIFWDYTDTFGKTWAPETYSRNFYGGDKWADGAINPTTHTITLRAPYNGPMKPKGTVLSNGSSGSTYMYSSHGALTSDWTKYSATISGEMSGTTASGKDSASFATGVPPGTAFVKFFVIVNHNSWSQAGSITKIAGISLSDASAAYDHATTAIQSANARNRSIFSTGNATGTSLNGYSFINGDMWYRRGTGDSIIGMWEFANGAWVSKTLNDQVIANLDAGKITAGTINADRIGAGTISANKLTIGGTENLVDNGSFEYGTEGWNLPSSGATLTSISAPVYGGTKALKLTTNSTYQLTTSKKAIEAEPGETYVATIAITRQGAVPTIGRVRFGVIEQRNMNDMTSGTYTWTLRTLDAVADVSTWKTFEFEFTVSNNRNYIVPMLDITSDTTPGTDYFFDAFSIKKKIGTTLIEDGAITTAKVDAEAITASELAAGAVTAHKIKAGEIDATKIVQGGMDGSVVIENGTITATEIAGQTITGDKIKGNTIDASHIVAGSITIGAPNSPLNPAGIATPSDVSTAKSQAISTAAGDATTKANAAQAAAIQAAATDAQTKADNAKTAAEQAAKDYADGQISQAEADAIAAAAIDAQAKANAAKQAAIDAAATDATTKANNAKSQAVTEAGTAADTKVANAVNPINTKLTGWTKTGTTFIDGGKIYTDSITAGQIAANAIGVSELAANAVTAAKIKAGEIDSTKIVSTGLDGSTVITNGTITTNKIGANQITGAKIAANTITVGNMGPDSVDRTVIKDGEIITAKLAANAVKAGNIDAGAITAGKIAAGAITIGPTAPIAPGTVAVPSDVTAAENRAKADAKSKADAAQAAAIQAAATDAQTKADAAKTAAESAAKAYADGEISSAALATANAAAADAQTKADAAKTAAEEYARSIQGGGVNIISQASAPSYTSRFLEVVIYDAVKDMPEGAKVVYSFDIRSATENEETVNIYPYQSTGKSIADSVQVVALSGEWKRYTVATTIKQHGEIPPPENRTWGGIGHYVPGNASGKIEIRNVKLELGEVASPFSLSPADVSAETQEAKADAIADADSKINPIKNLTEGWTFTGTTEINGGKIKADTIEAAQIATGAITIGKIAPNTVATPSDITTTRTYAEQKASNAKSEAITDANTNTANVVAPINTTIGNWKYGNTTFINGGSIYTRSITADRIAANSLTAGEIAANAITASELAANSVLAGNIKAGEITGDKLAVNTAIANSLQIQSALTINAAGGHIKSSNWNDTNKTGFYMDQQQLIVHNGRIEAAAIKLQDSSNIMPPTYASFNARESAYAVANMWTGSVSGTTKFPADGKFGGDSLQAVITANTGFIGMGHNATDLNIPIEGGQQYIISFYVSNRSSKVITLQPELYQTASILIKATATSIANSTAWTRYSMIVTAPATMTRAILRFNLTVGATATFRLDGIQVEQKIGQETAPSNWSPPGFTSIDGESITTGSISSSQTINTGNGAIARWSIDTNGNARFADATIDGKLIVGGYGTNQTKNANVAIQSDQYSAGIAGWAIKGNGDVEFNNGTFRGMLSLEKAGVDLTMNASVSSIDAYIDTANFKSINTANIRGTTYGYKRDDSEIEGVYKPTEPDPLKFAHFFIGPTTEKALNLQVHDGPEQDNIYLSEPPNNITLTSINLGEQTSPNAEPSFRESQGVVIKTFRNEARDYNLGGQQTGGDLNLTSSSYELLTRERSAVIPEIAVGESEYPQAKQEWASTSVYETPKAKNLFPSNFVRGGAFAYTKLSNTSITSVDEMHGVGQFGLGTHGHNIFNLTGSAAETGFDMTVNVPTAGPHIVSFYVNIPTQLSSPTYIRVAENSASFIANEGVSPAINHSTFGVLGANHTELLPGTKEKRVSFYINSLAAGTRTIRFRFCMNPVHGISIYKPQLERAAFRSDASLPAEIRQSYLPTPWTENDARSSSSVSFRLQAEPIIDPIEFERSFDPAYSRVSGEQTAEAVLSFSAENQSPGPKGYQAEDAEFKFSPKGLTFPGADIPYLPTGAAIDYDWTGMGTSRPAVGGSTSGMTTLINNHPVRVNNGKEVIDKFSNDITGSKDFQMPGWDIRNQAAEDVTLRVYAGSLRSSASNDRFNPAGDGLILARKTTKMSGTDQSVTVTMLKLQFTFTAWASRGGPVINIDPVTGARIVAYFDIDEDIIRVIRYSNYTTQAATILTAPFSWSGSAEFTLTLSRSGNNITLLANGNVLGTATNQSNLPNGLYTGISPRSGSYRNFIASDGGDVSGAPGELVHAVNVNNGRGLSVSGTNGAINVSAPGFYQVSMYLLPDGKFGTNSADDFQIMVNSGGTNHRMSSNLSKYGDGVVLIQGSTIAYLTGPAEFLIWTNDGTVNRVNKAEIRIVRLA